MSAEPMADRCQAPRMVGGKWVLAQCKRNATITVRDRRYCEQHAKIALGVPANVHLDASDAL